VDDLHIAEDAVEAVLVDMRARVRALPHAVPCRSQKVYRGVSIEHHARPTGLPCTCVLASVLAILDGGSGA
jgi:hypothetical protein